MTPADFVRALYDPDDRIAQVAIPRESARGSGGEEPKVEQRVWPASKAASDGVQAWLRHLNARKYDVFLGMNPMRERVRSRHKRDVLAVDRVWIDIDSDGPRQLERILGDAREGRIGQPRWALETSPGRVQVIWQLAGRGSLEPGRAEALMRGLVQAYGGDRAAVDVSRVLRWAGFRNHKRGGEGHPVEVCWQSSAEVEPRQFPSELYRGPDLPPHPAGARRREDAPRGGGRDRSASGQDWRWAVGALSRGGDPGEVALELERRRPDKSNPRDYAARTVRNAQASRLVQRAREALGRAAGISR